MAFAEHKVTLVRRPLGRGPVERLRAAVLDFTRWTDGSPVIAYDESLYECRLHSLTVGAWAPAGIPFEGRVFDAQYEVRWVAHDDRSFEMWAVADDEAMRDRAVDDPTYVIETAWRHYRRYYLLGTGTSVAGTFRDARYGPDKTFVYPVGEPTEAPRTGDDGNEDPRSLRAYVLVAEYYRDRPAWDGLSADVLAQTLDDPMLLAHRFVSVHAGRTIDG